MSVTPEAFSSMLSNIFRFSRLSHLNQSLPRYFKNGEALYISEIHMLYLISQNPEISAAQLALDTHRTASAISQIVTKLCGKGLVIKKTTGENKKTFRLSLSEKGRELLKEHISDDNEYYSAIFSKMSSITQNELDDIEKLISILYEHTLDSIDKKQFDRQKSKDGV